MAPEYALAGKYSVKSDIFSMGVVLLEIVSGKKNREFERYLWHPYFRYECNELDPPFLPSESGTRILLTSRLQPINQERDRDFSSSIVKMRLLTKEESWDLLRDKAFCEGLSCPPQLEKVGKEIAEKCEGLPLTILVVAHLLSEKEKRTPEYWNEVAAKKNHQLFMDAYDKISKIPRSKLINLWVVDRFLELNININSASVAISYLEELVANNVVMLCKKSTFNLYHTIKTCALHSSLWHLSKQKAGETKFALIISSPDDCLGDGMEGHHRLSIQSNVLFSIKDVHQLVEDNCAPAARSLLCFGPYHQYQVPLCFRLKLLRELDALSICFYEFPVEVLQLVWLTYLSLTSNGMIPTAICQLEFLEFFIVDRHQSIKSCNDASYLPMEIWSLPVLNHLQVTGSDLPNPCGASLDNLSTLSKVTAHSCSEVVLKGVPNLRELYIQIELTPEDDGKPSSFFAHASHLSQLNSFKCVIVNPEVIRPVVPFPILGEFLKKLYLSGLCYPWKEMRNIASLPILNVLKLKNNAFQGPIWKVEEGEFISLYILVIEDTDMVDWQLGHGAFGVLMSLVIKNCYKLKKIRGKFGHNLFKMEIVDCNPSCIKEMKRAIAEEMKKDTNTFYCDIGVHSSWDDKKLKK